jgi:hypothetical protein
VSVLSFDKKAVTFQEFFYTTPEEPPVSSFWKGWDAPNPTAKPEWQSASPRPMARGLTTLKEAIERNLPALALLQQGRALIEKGWLRGAMFAIQNGERISHCALGALGFGDMDAVRVPNDHQMEAATRLMEALPSMPSCRDASGYGMVAYYNDHIASGPEDILALYDRAIAAAGGPLD